MRSKIAIKGHPLHPLLVTLPVGLFVWTLVADIVYARSDNPIWFAIAFWTSIGAIITALVAAIAGFADYFTMARHTIARRIATTHMLLNLFVVMLFAIAVNRMMGIDPTLGDGFGAVLFLHGLAVVTLLASGWLGGEMVYRHRLAVLEPGDAEAPHPKRAAEAVREERLRGPEVPRPRYG